MKPRHPHLLLWALLTVTPLVRADTAVTPQAFAWRATLTLPPGASVARVDVPVEALLHVQSASGDDLRIFNAAGAVVPFALLGNTALQDTLPLTLTPRYPAHPVRSAAAPASAPALPSALFDTRADASSWSALTVHAELPRNALVHMTVETSADLQHWTAVAVGGPLFQFDGADAPHNTVLTFQTPVNLSGRYLRLNWKGSTGVTVQAVEGHVAPHHTPPALLRADLPAGTLQTRNAREGLEWSLGFATPLAALHLQATQNNSWVPVRIQGRNDASQPWRTLASSVVYRIDAQGAADNPHTPTPLGAASVRQLRVEATQGQPLTADTLRAAVAFAPLHMAFVASGPAPYTLAAGRAHTASAAVDAALLGSVLTSATSWADLPQASVSDLHTTAPGAAPPSAEESGLNGLWTRPTALWAALLLGVVALGGVARSLLKQLNEREAPPAPQAASGDDLM